ncbi:hypothetical protein [Pseudalkalibacillus hwajinpoensis]|uniref:hypothetical protein n=1 Tax=Guptibacillus hwajinpoensis TaxID=208199 RepID=UPI001CFE18E1|nr:hypothetical protein [Pseudalkalibacillus hwajinpoensis]
MKLSVIYMMNVTVLGLFGWAMVTYYDAAFQFRNFMSGNGDGVMINMTPILITLLIVSIIGFVITRNKRRNNKGWKEALLLPSELCEDDEREKNLTAHACRNAYIAMMFASPLLIAAMTLQPVISKEFSAYPILVLLLLPFVQMTVFYFSLRRKLK